MGVHSKKGQTHSLESDTSVSQAVACELSALVENDVWNHHRRCHHSYHPHMTGRLLSTVDSYYRCDAIFFVSTKD